MIQSLKVMLWGEEVGCLSWENRRHIAYFTYNPDFLRKGLDVSPLVASIKSVRNFAPIWGEDAKVYQRLPAFLADSLPDAWGSQLFDLWRQQNHIANADITPLDKLSFIGKRGMGALEFIPEQSREYRHGKIDIKELTDLAERIFTERENVAIKPEDSITMQSLLTVGTSAGGRQPKAIIAINHETGEIRSGQIAGQKGFEYYLLKFGNSEYSSAELEMTYYVLATKAGIDMMPSELYSVEGNRHFLTKRFDRDGEKKLHTQTLAAIYPGANSYEQLITVCRKLHLPETDCQQVFRRMVFNILANNTDDHIKNFSFIMNDKGLWRLSPAYDITYIFNSGGFLPDEHHCMYIRAKLSNITREDAIQFAKDNGIRRPDAIIRDVADALKQFKDIATQYGVAQKWIGSVGATIDKHLIQWGEKEKIKKSVSYTTSTGRAISDIHVEQTYKGNFHLLGNVNGIAKKYVISKNKDDHAIISRIGAANLTEDQLHLLAEKYLA